jgi:hypothetical protein
MGIPRTRLDLEITQMVPIPKQITKMVPISSIAVSTFKLTLQPIQRPLRFHK